MTKAFSKKEMKVYSFTNNRGKIRFLKKISWKFEKCFWGGYSGSYWGHMFTSPLPYYIMDINKLSQLSMLECK